MTSRNAPCTCGSGKKYKRCCGADEKTATSKRALLIGIGVVAVVLIAVGFGMRETESEPTRVIGSPSASNLPQRQGQPWEYDAATGSHWDPTHGHWHQGPPPANRAPGSAPGSAPGTVEAGNTPAPWEYDAAKNQHWDPEHGHWHDGPPPER